VWSHPKLQLPITANMRFPNTHPNFGFSITSYIHTLLCEYAYNKMDFRKINMGNNKEVNLFRVTANLYDFDQRDITKFVSFLLHFHHILKNYNI
jgi:hypothetical protein